MDDKFDKIKFNSLVKIVFKDKYPIEFIID
jgi:hypothetical protein